MSIVERRKAETAYLSGKINTYQLPDGRGGSDLINDGRWDGRRDGNINLEMHGAGESNPILGRCTMITPKYVSS